MSYRNRRLMIPMQIGALWALTACGGSVISPVIELPPPSLMQPCEPPVTLPVRDATQVEVERWWSADRARLVTCGSQVEGLQAWAEAVAGV